MKETKYIQLLSDATAVQTSVSFHHTQLNQFTLRCRSYNKDLTATIEKLHDTIRPLAAMQLSLSKDQLETIHGAQRVLEQHKKTLQKDYYKIALQYQKIIDKNTKEINEKILRQVNAVVTSCGFDLNKIRNIVDEIKPIIDTCQQNLQRCLLEINKMNIQITTLEAEMERLDLPYELQQTTKQIERISQDLARLHLQVQLAPQSVSEYRKDFLPLHSALHNLRMQADNLSATAQTDVTTQRQPHASEPHI